MEHILSVSWESGTLSAAFYVIQTMEAFVIQEVIDLRPNFSLFNNLYRQLNARYVIVSGHDAFVKHIMTTLNIPEATDQKLFHVKTATFNGSTKLCIYPRGDKSLQLNRQQILRIKLSGIPATSTDMQRQMYIDSILPMKQTVVVQCLGNLLDFLDTNWKLIFRFDRSQNIISNLSVYSMDTQLQMDDTTYEALKLFSSSRHPSAFKQEVRVKNREGFSVFGLLNKCSSKIGAVELKTIMQQPIKDMEELNRRYDSIEWLQQLGNTTTCSNLRRCLKNIYDIRTSYKRILEDPRCLPCWRAIQKSIVNGYKVLEIVQVALDKQENVGVLGASTKAIKNTKNLQLVIQALGTILDLNEEDNQSAFMVKKGVDQEVDDLKQTLHDLQTSIPEDFEQDIKRFTNSHPYLTYNLTFIPEMGFILMIVVLDEAKNIFQNWPDYNLVLCSSNSYYYNTPYCQTLNNQHGGLFNKIKELEDKIVANLLKFIDSVMMDIQAVINLCAQVDYLMAFAIVSGENNYVRPVLTREKVVDIKEGRHVLLEIKDAFVANDVTVNQGNLVNLITAPNSTGKSVYLKQIGSIAYLAHIGCFVPATAATIGILDAIYSRIYSPEALHQEVSSFLAEVQQMGKVMMNSTDRSLILIDEFGKGSNVDEGKAILVACVEELIERGRSTPITFLTTHYLDVYDLVEESLRPRITCYTMATRTDDEGALVATFQVRPGRCASEYAFKHAELRKTLLTLPGGSVSAVRANNASFCTLNESTVDFMAELTRKKITLAYNAFQDYLRTGDVNVDKIFGMMEEMTVSMDRGGMMTTTTVDGAPSEMITGPFNGMAE